ncbi:MAG: hypothetical protein KAT05_15275 [Spirochaetes bacterium]|nr:hypothetical protein [Spirochaetota bacterium]
MALSKFELYHGTVLSQIVRSRGISLKLFERHEQHGWGEYEVSDNHFSYRVIIKSSATVRTTRKGFAANFTFSAEDINRIRNVPGSILVCLVCADQEICTLEMEDVHALGLLRKAEACNVIVTWSKGTALHVKSKLEKLNYTIPRNRLKTFSWI